MDRKHVLIVLAVVLIGCVAWAATPIEESARENIAKGVGPKNMMEAGVRIVSLEARVAELEQRLFRAEALLRNSPELGAMERGAAAEQAEAIRRHNERVEKEVDEKNRLMRDAREETYRQRQLDLDRERNDLLRRQSK